MSSFTNNLEVTPCNNGIDWKLTKAFTYHVGSEKSKVIIKVPKGFVTDFASIPSLFISLTGTIIGIIGYFLNLPIIFIIGFLVTIISSVMPNWGKYGKAAIVHDYLYHCKMFDRGISDAIFLESMAVLSVPLIERKAMYLAVRYFGWLSWMKRK